MSGLPLQNTLVWIVLGLWAVLWFWELAGADSQANPIGFERTIINWGLGAISMCLALILPISTVSAAMLSQKNHGGSLDDLLGPLAVLVLLAARSLSTYGLHVAFHKNRWLWALHRVHHTDPVIDLSTGFRSHPLEVVIATVVAVAVVYVLKPPVWAVLAVDSILFLGSFWQHAAVSLKPGLSRRLEVFTVTPDIHKIHHSSDPAEYNRNYGDITTLWDRLFGTFKTVGGPIPLDLI